MRNPSIMIDIEYVYNRGMRCDFCKFIARNGSDMMEHLIDLHPEDIARHYLMKQITNIIEREEGVKL